VVTFFRNSKNSKPYFFFIESENQNPKNIDGIDVGHGRKTRLMKKVQSMVKVKRSGNDDVWRAMLWAKLIV